MSEARSQEREIPEEKLRGWTNVMRPESRKKGDQRG